MACITRTDTSVRRTMVEVEWSRARSEFNFVWFRNDKGQGEDAAYQNIVTQLAFDRVFRV